MHVCPNSLCEKNKPYLVHFGMTKCNSAMRIVSSNAMKACAPSFQCLLFPYSSNIDKIRKRSLLIGQQALTVPEFSLS